MKFLRLLFLLSILIISFGFPAQNIDKDSLQFTLQIIVNDIKTKEPINDVKVKIIGTDGSSREYFLYGSNNLGKKPKIKLNPNTSYSIVLEKNKYYSGKGKETTVGFTESMVFIHEYELKRLLHLTCFMFPKIFFKNNELVPFLEDKTDNDINGWLLNIMTENPSLIFEIKGYRDFSEKKEISKKRTMTYANELIKLGIDKARLIVVDGGVRNYKKFSHNNSKPKKDLLQENRIITFQIISNDFPIEK